MLAAALVLLAEIPGRLSASSLSGRAGDYRPVALADLTTATVAGTESRGYDLALTSCSVDTRGGYVVFEGTVKNLSNRPLPDVLAVVLLYDENTVPQSSADAMIQLSPLAPGQESPWRVTLKPHPDLPLFGVQFERWHAGSLRVRDDRTIP